MTQSQTNVNIGPFEGAAGTLAGAGMVLYGLTRRSLGGVALALTGGALFYRGATRHCPAYAALGINTARRADAVKIEQSVTVNRPRADVFRFWRDFENLPRFMTHLESVQVRGERSHWAARSIGGVCVEWDAEITAERDGELIRWHSIPGSDIETFGSVRFKDAPGQRGTELRVLLAYLPPGGRASRAVAQLLRRITAQQVKEELRRFKEIMETGEVPTTEGQPAGGRRRREGRERRRRAPIQLAHA